jgi:hypothetical protein
MPFGPVSTEPTLGRVADASLTAVAVVPDPAGAAFVVVGGLADELHAAVTRAIAASDPMSHGYRRREVGCRSGVRFMDGSVE